MLFVQAGLPCFLRRVTDGQPVSSTNPGSRPKHGDSDADTLAADAIRKSGRSPDSNGRLPNEAMQDAHAELYGLQELHRQGRTEGRSLKMVVSGRKVCPMYRQDLPQAAKAAGLNEWTIFEEESGDTLYWKHGDTQFHLISGE